MVTFFNVPMKFRPLNATATLHCGPKRVIQLRAGRLERCDPTEDTVYYRWTVLAPSLLGYEIEIAGKGTAAEVVVRAENLVMRALLEERMKTAQKLAVLDSILGT